MKRQFDDVLLGSIELFCMAAEHSSFTAAANSAGVTPAAVSRSISRLEERLGVRLFVRTTRHIQLTNSGREYYEECRLALSQLIEAERRVTGQQLEPSGILRISMSTSYGHYRILPLLPKYRARYPQVRVEIHLSNRNIDFVEEGYDLAIRGRSQHDSSLISRRLEDAPLVVVGSPDYLKRAGIPHTLEELEQHDCIQFELASNGRHIPWLFTDNGAERELPTVGGYSCADDYLGCVTLAQNGGGLFQTYRFIVDKDLREGRLQEVLQPFAGRSRPFSLLYQHARHVPLRVRSFVEFLMENRW